MPSTPSSEAAVRRIMRESGFKEDSPLVFSSPDNLSGKPATPRFVQFGRNKAREIEAAVPGARARANVVDAWVTISVTLPEEASTAKKSAKQLDREISEALAKAPKPEVAYGLSAIDDDEWSWTVERMRSDGTTWGTGSESVASGVEYTRAEAVANIKKALARLGVDVKDAVALPF